MRFLEGVEEVVKGWVGERRGVERAIQPMRRPGVE